MRGRTHRTRIAASTQTTSAPSAEGRSASGQIYFIYNVYMRVRVGEGGRESEREREREKTAAAHLGCTSVTKPLEAQTCCRALSARFQQPLDGGGIARHRAGCRLALQRQHIWRYDARHLDAVVFLFLSLRQHRGRRGTQRPPRRPVSPRHIASPLINSSNRPALRAARC